MAKIPDKPVTNAHAVYSDGSTKQLSSDKKVVGISLGDDKVLVSGMVNVPTPKTRWYTRLWNRIRGKRSIYIDR